MDFYRLGNALRDNLQAIGGTISQKLHTFLETKHFVVSNRLFSDRKTSVLLALNRVFEISHSVMKF